MKKLAVGVIALLGMVALIVLLYMGCHPEQFYTPVAPNNPTSNSTQPSQLKSNEIEPNENRSGESRPSENRQAQAETAKNNALQPELPVVDIEAFQVVGFQKTVTLSGFYQDDIKSLWHTLYFAKSLANELADRGVNTRQMIGVYHDYMDSMGQVTVTIGYTLPSIVAQRWDEQDDAEFNTHVITVKKGRYQQDNSQQHSDVLAAWGQILSQPSNRQKFALKTDYAIYQRNHAGEISPPKLYLGLSSEQNQ